MVLIITSHIERVRVAKPALLKVVLFTILYWNVSAASTGSSQTSIPWALESDEVSETSVGLRADSFFQQSRLPNTVSNFTFVSGRLRQSSKSEVVTGYVDLNGMVGMAVENYSNLSVRQAHLSWNKNGYLLPKGYNVSLVLGRHLVDWSWLDSAWGFGLWNPVNRFDALRPEEMGLSGLFVGLESKLLDLTVFVSGVYFPEQGPSYDLQNGKFRSVNPWAAEPPNVALIMSEKTNIIYDLNSPNIGSVINQPSFGLRARWRQDDEVDRGWQAYAAFAIKPRNQLALPFEASLKVDQQPVQVQVRIHPKVVFHQVASSGLSFAWKDGSAGLDGLAEWAQNQPLDSELTYQVLDTQFFAGPRVQQRFFVGSKWAPDVFLAYLRTWNGRSSIAGKYQSEQDIYGPRTQWRDAIQLGVGLNFALGSRWIVQPSLRWLEEVAEGGTVLWADCALLNRDRWRIVASADLLGSRLDPAKQNTFISKYRNKDHASIGLVYQF